jgi:GxxExxY protein
MEVHRILGPGPLEAVYHEALEIEVPLRTIPFEHQPQRVIHFKGHEPMTAYYPDLRVMGGIIVELKARYALHLVDEAPVIKSLTCAHHDVALLINFGETSLKWERFVV